MSVATSYQEPMNEGELAFLTHKADTERRQYTQVGKILFALCLLFAYLGGVYRMHDFGPENFSFTKFLVTFGILLFICSFSMFVVYRTFLQKVQHDLKNGLKTIESHRILRKLFVPMKSTYHFYIDSAIKISIQVSAEDFTQYKVGDEVFIEFASYSKEYFGYF